MKLFFNIKFKGVNIMSIFSKLKKFYKASSENKTQIHLLFAFIVIPFVGMLIFGTYVMLFWLPKTA